MGESRTVTLSPEASAAVERIARKLHISFEQALGRAIWTQDTVVTEAQAGKTVTIGGDGTTLNIKTPY